MLQALGTIAVFVIGGVFVFAFRFARAEATSDIDDDGDLPRAELHGAHVRSSGPFNRWHRGARRQRLLRKSQLAQALLVAFAITSVFVMLLCMVGIFAAMIIGI